VTPAVRAFAHVEYLTFFLTFGAEVAFVVGTAVGAGAVVGETRVMGFIPAVTAYAGIEKAVIDVMLHWETSEVSALASAVSIVNE
jgi:hypothetical protein